MAAGGHAYTLRLRRAAFDKPMRMIGFYSDDLLQ